MKLSYKNRNGGEWPGLLDLEVNGTDYDSVGATKNYRNEESHRQST